MWSLLMLSAAYCDQIAKAYLIHINIIYKTNLKINLATFLEMKMVVLEASLNVMYHLLNVIKFHRFC